MRKARAPIRRWGHAPLWHLAAWICVLLATPALAHESLPAEITQATQTIREDPDNPQHYLHRAELFRLHRHWRAALDDYARAEELAPDLAGVVLGRAALQLDSGQPRAGLSTLQAWAPRHAPAVFWELSSRAYEMCDQPAAAVEAQTRFLAMCPNVRPEDVLRRARLGIAAGEASNVVLGHLVAGIARVGPAPALQELAIRLELRLHNYDRALARLAMLESSSSPSVAILARRGDILALAGRALEARAVYTEALDHLETLGPDRRFVPTHRALERQLRSVLSAPLSIHEGHAKD